MPKFVIEMAPPVLVSRFWPEPAQDDPFRVRITSSRAGRNEPIFRYATNPDQVLTTVSERSEPG